MNSPAERLRIAFYLPKFPVASETFIVSQIEGLIARGAIVDVVAEQREPGAEEAAARLGLADLRFQRPLSYGKLRRVRQGIGILAALFTRAPAVAVRGLDVVRHGRAAASLRLLFAAEPFVGHRYDVVLCHFGPMGLQAVHLRRIGALRGAVATVFHGFDASNVVALRGAGYYAPLFRYGDLLLPVSDFWRDRLIEWGADPARVRVHHMGVRVPAAVAQSSSGGGAAPATDPIRILTVARLVEKKGIEYALRALASLGEEPGWEFVIVGDGPLRARLESLAVELGIADRVRFGGWCEPPEVARLLGESAIFLAPSVTARNGDQEGIPVALMEAMAAGVPAVSSLHTGIPELVEDGVGGYLLPERDVDGLAGRLRELIRSPALRQRMGAAARRAVADRYEIETLNDRLAGILADVAARRASRQADLEA